MHSGGLELALVLMLAAIVAVPVFKRFGLGAVLAYLVAGVVLGPDGVGVVQDAERISGAAEIGVVMLLFVIGLELSPALLKVMRHSVFGAGATQVLVTAVILGGLLMAARLGWKSALIVGVALALSSTAVGLQLLAERKALNSDYGRLAFAILLFQDLIAIPLLASIPLLGGSKNDALEWQDVAKAIAALALVIVCGRFVLRHLFNVVGARACRKCSPPAPCWAPHGSCRKPDWAPAWAPSSPACCWPIRNFATNWNRRSSRLKACCWACSSSRWAWGSISTAWWPSRG